MAMDENAYATPIKDRTAAQKTLASLHAAGFIAIFNFGIVAIHAFQVTVLLPLYLVNPRIFFSLVGFTKHAFGVLLLFVTHFFGPSKYVLTADSSVDLDKLVKRNEDGSVRSLELMPHSIWIANHQCYADWLVLWIVYMYGGISTGLLIILKASLRWAPMVGPAMQIFQFSFISKTRPIQQSGFVNAAKRYFANGLPFALMIYPEGTLVSANTRKRSVAYAEAQQIPDRKNLLLPRSTGLLYCLRSLASTTPDLTLYDVAIGYAGVPSAGYAQDYYTLMSIFANGHSPPTISLHLRTHDLSQVPIGDVKPNESAANLDARLKPEQRKEFDLWMRERWVEKDELMDGYYATGKFPSEGGSVTIDVGMRHAGDWFTFASMPVMLWAAWRVGRLEWRLIAAVLRLVF